ncbi:GntR family transcriptional regulator [Acuticoccus sediminis]|uniref:GntR family transcriptional regulator n=1 Tax=Acuticoccus sediminis TaxID=2184697 RepID=A0A8B2NPU5_9HYPH|nr:GntR family transcriptional regulator [Acuticoccus sediminis]RAI01905.1 GntR family transcriptional regulator [Acuticoccus sediminis]
MKSAPAPDETVYASRAEYVHETLRAEMRSGQLKPGSRVREAELAERLKVSRTPIREAIRRLVENGLLEYNNLGGLSVARLDRAQVSELYALRAILEGAAASLAARHATREDVERIADLAEACARADTPAAAAHYNNLFHEGIHSCCRNRYLETLQMRFSDWLSLLPGTTFSTPGRIEQAHKEHSEIVEAIRSGDAEAAHRAAHDHIIESYRIRLKMMFPDLPPKSA